MIAIVLHTFRALLREKIIYNVFGVTVLFLFIGYLASQLVFGFQHRVMLDIGVMVNAISVFLVAISVGARFFRQEIESKTIYLFLVRPLSRTEFFFSRFAGMALFLLLNYTILSLVLWLAVMLALGNLSLAFLQSFFLTYLESLILLAASILFGFWFRPALVFMIMTAIVFLGHNHALIASMQSGLDVLTVLTPNFSALLMGDRIYYEETLSAALFLNGLLFGGVWVFFFTLIGNAVFSRKNL
jgi:ABC-type transport system involved in multi-copper enzyme maturation permease subunit